MADERLKVTFLPMAEAMKEVGKAMETAAANLAAMGRSHQRYVERWQAHWKREADEARLQRRRHWIGLAYSFILSSAMFAYMSWREMTQWWAIALMSAATGYAILRDLWMSAVWDNLLNEAEEAMEALER